MKLIAPRIAFALAVALAPHGVTTALAQSEVAYSDDRSTAESLVRSYFNALNRHEYARAWDYFSDAKPASSFESFVEGYGTTERLAVETGAVSQDSADGGLHYQIPVAVVSTSVDGAEARFAGCFTARLADPAEQTPPFHPLQLEKAELQPFESSAAEALKTSCGETPATLPKDPLGTAVQRAFAATYGNVCQTLSPDADIGAANPQITELTYRDAGQAESEPDRKARLFRYNCIIGAYNETQVYYLADDQDVFRQLQFSQPDLEIHYRDNDSQNAVESVNMIGYTTTDVLVNSSYDEQTHTLQANNKWRGAGDASAHATYLFRNGTFSLTKYDVDASFDGEINPEPVLDFDTAP